MLGRSFPELLVGQPESQTSLAVRASQRSCREKHMVQPPPGSGSLCDDTEVGLRYHSGKSTGSVQFICSVVSDSLRPHAPQHTRPPCPSPIPGVYPNSCLSSRWCHPAISSSVIPFSSCPQSLPASGSFPLSQLFAWGGQSTGVSFLASLLPKKSQGWSPSEWTGWDLLAVQGTLKSLLQHHSSKASIIRRSAFFTVQLSQPYMNTGKTIALTRRTLVAK